MSEPKACGWVYRVVFRLGDDPVLHETNVVVCALGHVALVAALVDRSYPGARITMLESVGAIYEQLLADELVADVARGQERQGESGGVEVTHRTPPGQVPVGAGGYAAASDRLHRWRTQAGQPDGQGSFVCVRCGEEALWDGPLPAGPCRPSRQVQAFFASQGQDYK